jgi:hypothetical protein
MATADQIIAVEQTQRLREYKKRLQDEFLTLTNATVIARRQEIQDQVAVIDVQLALIAPRLPPARVNLA